MKRKVVAGVLYEEGKPCAVCKRPMSIPEQMRWPPWVHDECFYVMYPSFHPENDKKYWAAVGGVGSARSE